MGQKVGSFDCDRNMIRGAINVGLDRRRDGALDNLKRNRNGGESCAK